MRETIRKIRAATSVERSCLCSPKVSVQISLFVLVCLGAGCESGFGARQQNDPMFGMSAAPNPVSQPGTPGTALAQATSGPVPVPPIPSSHTAPSTAPLAGGEAATPESPRDLRIAGGSISSTPPYPPQDGVGRGGTSAARGAAPVVTVGNPEPAAAGTTANLMKPPVPPPTASAANIRTYEEAQQLLQQQRVSWQHLDMDDGQWKFECGVPNPSNPQLNRHYATTRAFPDPLSAIREVLTQIEKKEP
jgi:hypothetical protein